MYINIMCFRVNEEKTDLMVIRVPRDCKDHLVPGAPMDHLDQSELR